jgi:tripartite-type tricarboxylate transporter receptor subunit TctC
MVVHAPPDGYTALVVSSPHAINATLYDKLNFNFIRDIAPVAGIMRVPNVMVVAPSFPAQSVAAFIAYGKANPGKLNFASSGVGASNHMSGELFKAMTGLDMTHVPYRSSGPALTDLIGGQVQVMFDAITSTVEHIKAGRLRTLGVTSATKAPALPETPVIADFVPGYEVSNWFGFGMPRNTPPDAITTFNRAVNDALADSKLKIRLAELGGILMPGSPADFGKLIAEETEKWGNVIRSGSHQAGLMSTCSLRAGHSHHPARVTRRSVTLMRPPSGSSVEVPGMMRSTPWKASRAAPPRTTASPDDSLTERVGSLRFCPPTRNRQVSPSESDTTGAAKSSSSRS